MPPPQHNFQDVFLLSPIAPCLYPFYDTYSLVVITYFFIHLLNLTENPQAMPRMQKPLKKYWLNGKSLQIYAINLN